MVYWKKQQELQQKTNLLQEWISGHRRLHPEDNQHVQEQLNQVLQQTKRWNEASQAAIDQQENLLLLMRSRFAKARQVQRKIYHDYIKSSAHSRFTFAWNAIDDLAQTIEAVEGTVVPATELDQIRSIDQKLDHLIEKVSPLKGSTTDFEELEIYNLQSKLEEILPRQGEGLGETLGKAHKKMQELKKRTAQLLPALKICDDADGPMVEEHLLDQIYLLHDTIQKSLSSPVSQEAPDLPTLCREMDQLSSLLDRLLRILKSLHRIHCDSCEEIRALLMPLNTSLAAYNEHLAKLIEDWGKKIESYGAQIGAIVDKAKQLGQFHKTNHIAEIWRYLQDIQRYLKENVNPETLDHPDNYRPGFTHILLALKKIAILICQSKDVSGFIEVCRG